MRLAAAASIAGPEPSRLETEKILTRDIAGLDAEHATGVQLRADDGEYPPRPPAVQDESFAHRGHHPLGLKARRHGIAIEEKKLGVGWHGVRSRVRLNGGGDFYIVSKSRQMVNMRIAASRPTVYNDPRYPNDFFVADCPPAARARVIVTAARCHRIRRNPTKEARMQYLLMIYSNEGDWARLTDSEREQGVAAYRAYTESLRKADIVLGMNRLQHTNAATTVRLVDGKPQVLDGPYSDSKEQLAGYFLIDVPDLDAAIAWAARCPGAAHGIMEVRPVWTAACEAASGA
jgi:hypothetical protein